MVSLSSEGRDYVLSRLLRQNCQILKRASFEEAATPFRKYLASRFAQVSVNFVKVRELGTMSRSGESVH